MSDSVSAITRAGVTRAIANAAEATGVDFAALVETARRESAFNPQAQARTSSATGLFQFIDGTWLDMVRRCGAQHGLGGYAAALQNGPVDAATRREILNLRFDPEIAARMAGELWKENAASLQASLGRAPSASELYAAHVLGPGGAARLIEAAQAGAPSAAALFPQAAAANRPLFFNAAGAALSAKETLQRLSLDASPGKPMPAQAAQATAAPLTSPLSAQTLDALLALFLGRVQVDGWSSGWPAPRREDS